MDAVERLREIASVVGERGHWQPGKQLRYVMNVIDEDGHRVAIAGSDVVAHIVAWDPTAALAALDVVEALERLRMAYAEAAGQPADADTFWRHIRDADGALAAFEKAAGEA